MSEWPSSKNPQTSAGESVEKREPSCTAGGMQTDIAIMEDSMEFPLEKNKHTNKQNKKTVTKLPYDPAIPLLGIYLRKLKLKDTCTPIFIAALFTIARTWKQLRCPLTDEWIKKLYIHKLEC